MPCESARSPPEVAAYHSAPASLTPANRLPERCAGKQARDTTKLWFGTSNAWRVLRERLQAAQTGQQLKPLGCYVEVGKGGSDRCRSWSAGFSGQSARAPCGNYTISSDPRASMQRQARPLPAKNGEFRAGKAGFPAKFHTFFTPYGHSSALFADRVLSSPVPDVFAQHLPRIASG